MNPEVFKNREIVDGVYLEFTGTKAILTLCEVAGRDGAILYSGLKSSTQFENVPDELTLLIDELIKIRDEVKKSNNAR